MGCCEVLILRQGHVNQPHFAHRSTSTCGGGEGILHLATKRWFAECVAARRATIVAACIGCGVSRTVWEPLIPSTAVEELALRPGGGPIKYRIDVAVVMNAYTPQPDPSVRHQRLIAAVEVWNTHRIGPEKRAYLEKLAPVFEIRAEHQDLERTTFTCAEPTGACAACARKRKRDQARRARAARVLVLIATLRQIGCVRSIVFAHCAKTLRKRLVHGRCRCGNDAVYTNSTGRVSYKRLICARCAAECAECNETVYRNCLLGEVCIDCVVRARLVECRLCGVRDVDPEDTKQWLLDWDEYKTFCPGLCADCERTRSFTVRYKPDKSQ
jgi:hypothetical protein